MNGSGLAGFALVAAFLLMGLWLESVRDRPVYRRPAVLIQPYFWQLWTGCRWLLFLAGWGLAFGGYPRTSAGLALALAAAWGWKRLLRGRRHRQRMLRRAFDREKARDPSAGDVQILRRVLSSLHPHWGEELIEQIASDNPTPEGVADMVLRMERGGLPSGFHPARLLRRR